VTHLYLIRHGEAVCNVIPTLAGAQGDAGLTPRGVIQAQRLRDRLAVTGEIAADALIASTLPRARQTAEIIAPALGLPIIWDDDVQELRPGEADGLRWDEYLARYGEHNFRLEPFRPLSPGGEHWGAFILRVGAALDRIARQYLGQTIVIVCHGGVIDASFLCFSGMSTLAPPPLEFFTRNTAITHWEQRQYDGRPPRWRLLGYNDDLHVRDIGAEERIRWPRAAAAPAPGGAQEPAVPLPTEEHGG
jgi:probable phosphoglycerate mutase